MLSRSSDHSFVFPHQIMSKRIGGLPRSCKVSQHAGMFGVLGGVSERILRSVLRQMSKKLAAPSHTDFKCH
jgi:hypothetical protein